MVRIRIISGPATTCSEGNTPRLQVCIMVMSTVKDSNRFVHLNAV